MLIRLFIKMFFFVTLGRWMYAEMNLVVPSSIPLVDSALKVIQIPTHDQWPEVDWQGLFKNLNKEATLALRKTDHYMFQLKQENNSKEVAKLLNTGLKGTTIDLE